MKFNFEDIDEEEDIVVPDSFLGEFIYIKFVIIKIFQNPKNALLLFKQLKRQIAFFLSWKKIK